MMWRLGSLLYRALPPDSSPNPQEAAESAPPLVSCNLHTSIGVMHDAARVRGSDRRVIFGASAFNRDACIAVSSRAQGLPLDPEPRLQGTVPEGSPVGGEVVAVGYRRVR